METKRCQRCHKLLRIDAQVCSRCGGDDFTRAAATRSRQTVRLTPRPGDASFPSNPPASSHRAGHYSGLHPEDQPYQSSFLPVQRPPVSMPYTILEEPEEFSPVTDEDNGELMPVGELDFATMPEPELFEESPATKRQIATFTPLPAPRQQRGSLAYPASPISMSPRESAEVYQPMSPVLTAPPVYEPPPIMLQPEPRQRGLRGGIIPVLLLVSCFLFLVATSILAFLLFSNKPVPALTPKLTAEPSAFLLVGDNFFLSGIRFPANAKLRFSRDNSIVIKDQNGHPLEETAYNTGSFSVSITITRDWSVGQHTIFAYDQLNDFASTTILVAAAPASTTPPHLQLMADRFDMGVDNAGAITHNYLTLRNTGAGQVHWEASSDAPWLSVSPSKGTFSGSAEVEITVNRGTLAAKSYSGHLKFKEQSSQQALVLTVTMAVKAAPPSAIAAANLALSSAALAFSGTPAQNPAGQVLTLQNTGGLPLNWTATATTSGGGNWIVVSPASGSLPGGGQQQVTVSALTAGLGAGNYSGTLNFTYGAASTSVVVTLAVTPPPVPGLAVQPSGGITFNSIQGQNPLPKSFSISNPGNAPLNWSITEDGNGASYAPVSAKQGTLAAGKSILITVMPSITQLNAATITAHITVSNTDPGTPVKSQQITVTFVIVNQAVISLSDTQMVFDSNSNIQSSSQLLLVTNTGSASLKWALSITNKSPVQWLTVDNTGGVLAPGATTAPVNVTCDSTNLSPGTYNATIQVYDTDTGTPVSPITVPVTLVVS